MSFYQKYRPKDFDSLVGQDFIKTALRNALVKDKLVGAYLFYGSRWTGKTTVARILARWVNCLDLGPTGNPCGVCENCAAFEDGRLMDIIEIDAASNTGVDNIRDLIEKAQFQPNQAKYKVYIIDEVHMLSKGAFNALLKTLEEPPAHVKFILATTELHKIPETIVSRTQRFDFKKIDEGDIVGRLTYIANEEKICAEQDALRLIAKLARGGMRDAIALFEQYAVGECLTYEMIAKNLQLVGESFLEDFTFALIEKNQTQVLKDLDFLRQEWVDMRIFLEQAMYFLRDKLISHLGAHLFPKFFSLFNAFQEIYSKLRFVPNTFVLFEVSILALIHETKDGEIYIAPKKQEAKEEKIVKKSEASHPEFSSGSHDSILVEKTNENKQNEGIAKQVQNDVSSIDWSGFNFLSFIEEAKKSPGKSFVVMSLKASSFSVDRNILFIHPSTDFHKNKINTPEILGFLSGELEKIVGAGAEIRVELGKWTKPESLADVAKDMF